MRKLRWIYAFVGGLFLVTGGLGIAAAAPSPQVITAHRFDISKPLRDMRWQLPPLMQQMLAGSKATPAQIERLRAKLVKAGVLPAPGAIRESHFYRKKPARSIPLPVRDAAVQRAIPRTGTWAPNAFTSPSISFDGVGDSTGYYSRVFPPSANAAVGMNYVVEIMFGDFAVFKKSDGTMVLGPVPTRTLWSGFGGSCEGFSTHGDPIVMYDQLAHRWVISMNGGPYFGRYYACIAVSTTNDPTGSWYRYAFGIDKQYQPMTPKLGVWPDAYYYTANFFKYPSINYGFAGVAFIAFDRAQLIAGDPTAQVVLFNVPLGSGQMAYSVLPATLDGYNLPPAGAPGIFLNYVSPNLWGTSNYALQMWRMHVDWQTPANSTLTGSTQITVPAFNDVMCGGYLYCIPEPYGARFLNPFSDRLMYRLAYRNLGSRQALVVDQTVGVNNTNPPAAMRWYQLTAPTNSNTWSLAQSGTFAPGVTTAGGPSRWMGSIAMDHHGDIALGYSLSSTTIAPSIAYTGQVVGSPLGKMSEPETILKAGGGAGYVWGHYSSMASDPVDSCTFWYTNEYYATTSFGRGWSTHIGAFAFPGCPPIILGTLSGTVSVAATGQPGKDAIVVLEPGDIVTLAGADGKYSFRLPAGGYTVEALKYPDLAKAVSVAVSLDQTTTQDLSLQAAPLVTLSGKVIDAGLGKAVVAHGWPLYAGITVTTPYVGKVAEVFTDPVTGVYHMQLAQNFPYTLQVVAHSNYQSVTTTLAPLTKDVTKDFTLAITMACTAPGYAVPFSENFNGATFPPSGWTVTNMVPSSLDVWNTNLYWMPSWALHGGNFTGGTGLAAVVDSLTAFNWRHWTVTPYDTSLITPKIPVSSLAANPEVKFLMQYWTMPTSGGLNVDINVDGTGWTTMKHFHTSAAGGDSAGVTVDIDLKPYIPSGAQEIQIRWRYYDLASVGWDGRVEVDDATVGRCQATSGGLIVGRVTDADTGDPVAATVYDDLNEATATFTNPADLNLKNRNLYILFASSGQRTLTAAGNNNGLFDLAVLPVGDDTVTQHNFPLGNADLDISQISGGTVTQGTQGNVGEVVVTNNGPDTAAGVQLAVNSIAGASATIRVESATTTAGTCTVNSQTNGVDCSLGDISSGQSVTVAVSAFGLYVGQVNLSAVAGEADHDPDASNNSAVATVKVVAAVVKVPAQGSGGGSLGLWSLILLFGLAGIMITMRIRRRRGL